MSAATITSKGQITIPKEIRALLDLHTGDRVDFIVEDRDKVRFVPVTKNVTSLKGMVPKPERPVSIEEMAATVKSRGGRL